MPSPKPAHLAARSSLPAARSLATRGSARAALKVSAISSRTAADAGGADRAVAWRTSASTRSRLAADSFLIVGPSGAASPALSWSPSSASLAGTVGSAQTSWLISEADLVGLPRAAISLAAVLSSAARACAASSFRRDVKTSASPAYNSATASLSLDVMQPVSPAGTAAPTGHPDTHSGFVIKNLTLITEPGSDANSVMLAGRMMMVRNVCGGWCRDGG